MKISIPRLSHHVLLQFLTLSIAAYALPSLDIRNPADSQSNQDIPAVGSMTQSAATVLAVIEAPGTETTVSFSKFTSPSPQLKQSDSMVCIIEALQEIYSGQRNYGISTHLSKTWTYSGSQQPKNLNCLTMQNYDDKDHILTWGIVVEALRAVALALGNTTSAACQFDVYSKQWGHVGYGSSLDSCQFITLISMASAADPTSFILPKVPVSHREFLPYINGKTGSQVAKAVAPFNSYEAKLREGFAQHRDHPSLQNPHVNAVPVFNPGEDVPRICKRDVDDDTHQEKYIIPLSSKNRKPAGAPATVESMQDFIKNFSLFSESSLADLDWSNVVAAGSAVVTPLLPVPAKYNTSKKALREYYHQHLAPSSDVDLFIWGLDEAAALEKIKQIEASVRNAILEEVTTVRTKNAITIASHYPIRHVQIVLRLYKSVSEILTGFDVDCSCFAYDGNQVYGTPRGIAAFMTQTNTIELTRRSPSYESRLSKYAHRGFEVYWSELDRSRVDPTIFERSFARTVGLARLLVLEQLPKPADREDYLNQRREERGRPSKDTYYRQRRSLPANVKDRDPDDIPEWVYDDEISNYHSFTVPYGPKYHAKKIEKLLYTKDLLLNAEWNQNRDRTVTLHRHPCFIGPIESVLHDCCGFCPEPQTDEEREVAEEESKIYVSGDVTFMRDDPGRQAIGSFKPLTDDDWTDMAYIGNTQELCQRICNGDVEFVDAWCKNNPDTIDRRDHTGRTPLHLAAECPKPEVLRCLVDHGARIVSRLVDGMTALHIAAAQGSNDMVTTLLEKSEANEAEEGEKKDRKKVEKSGRPQSTTAQDDVEMDDDDGDGDEDSDDEMQDTSSEDDVAMTEGSFVKVANKKRADEDALDGDDESEPDIYDVNVLAWDTPVSPLHLAILSGHTEVIKTLIGRFGADALLPIKIVNEYNRSPKHAIMTMVLAARLSYLDSLEITRELLAHGASSAQADVEKISALHYLVAKKKVDLLKACISDDGAAAKSAMDHIVPERTYYKPRTDNPLTTAIKSGNAELVDSLLDAGAKPVISLDDYASACKAVKEQMRYYIDRVEDVSKPWRESVTQPILLAAENDMPEIVLKLVDAGADVNTLDNDAQGSIANIEENKGKHLHGKSVLDAVTSKIGDLEKSISRKLELPQPPCLQEDGYYLKGTKPGTYTQWHRSKSVEMARNIVKEWGESRVKQLREENDRPGQERRLAALRALKARYIDLQKQLQKRGAKPLEQLHPEASRRKHDDDGKADASKEKPFAPKVTFSVSASDEVLNGYVQLFEAAWEGKNDKIKELTLAKWGPESRNKPLQVSTQDSEGFTPFAIAMYRRHFESAKLLLRIADVQFKEPDKRKQRYVIGSEDEYDDSADEDSDSDVLDIASEVVDDVYTYDNVTALQDSVGSSVSAVDMLEKSAAVWWFLDKPEREAMTALGQDHPSNKHILREDRTTSTLTEAQETFKDYTSSSLYHSYVNFGRYAMVVRDTQLLRFWLQCCQDASKMKWKDHKPTRVGLFYEDFRFGLQHGYVAEIAELIRFLGAELPLDALIQTSEVDSTETPKYYQGLSIGGKKMTAWAKEHGGGVDRASLTKSTPPLLQAAHAGGLAAVEWFLSDTPLRLYREYRDKHKDDERLRKLAEAPGGFEQAVGSWLKQRNNLALHGAVLSGPANERSLEVIKYLIAVMPESINVPSKGHSLTPLGLAFLKGRADAAKVLINAGADQTTRDSSGKNLVHLAVIYASKTNPTDVDSFKTLLGLIDKRVICSLLTERCRNGPGGLTPLAYWLAKTNIYYSFYYSSTSHSRFALEIFDVLIDFGGEEAITMMDGSGQFPLHLAVKTSHTRMVKKLLEHDPALLSRENAMGQTALELAHSMYLQKCADGNPDIRGYGHKPLEQRTPEEFAKTDDEKKMEKDEFDDWDTDVARTWKICKEFAEREPRPRRLVSVNEAREVARRLAERKQRERESEEQREEEKEKGMEKKERKKEDEEDEVSAYKWLGHNALELE
ncbi:MAG: hypothetical protein Q9181_004356 [Wetmoreana brouardii]